MGSVAPVVGKGNNTMRYLIHLTVLLLCYLLIDVLINNMVNTEEQERQFENVMLSLAGETGEE